MVGGIEVSTSSSSSSSSSSLKVADDMMKDFLLLGLIVVNTLLLPSDANCAFADIRDDDKDD